ncbi:MAG: hypothetical protein AAFR98_11900 [Pseudomonadota bacterium]
MREGDIYRWRYKQEIEKKRGGLGGFGAYHCKSCIAVFDGKHLVDTFWGQRSTEHAIDPERVDLVLVGNKNDLIELNDNEAYYDPNDLVVMRHSNDSRAKTLMKPDAKRDPDVMRKLLVQKRGDAEREMQSASRDLERIAVALHRLENGEINKLYF